MRRSSDVNSQTAAVKKFIPGGSSVLCLIGVPLTEAILRCHPLDGVLETGSGKIRGVLYFLPSTWTRHLNTAPPVTQLRAEIADQRGTGGFAWG